MTNLYKKRRCLLFSCALTSLLLGCAPSEEAPDAGLPDAAPPASGNPCALVPAPTGPEAPCATILRYRPLRRIQTVTVAGEWNGFEPKAQPLSGPDANGQYSIRLDLAPGIYAYKLVLDGTEWRFDDGNSYRRY